MAIQTTPDTISMCIIPEHFAQLWAIVEERKPFETIIMLGGGCCDGTEAQLVDRLILNERVDQYIGDLLSSAGTEKRIPVYAAPSAVGGVCPVEGGEPTRLQFIVSALPENRVSDSFSLEVATGLKLSFNRI